MKRSCTSGKIISFPQEAYKLAERFCARRNRDNHLRMRVYWCDECECWHFTSQPQHVSYPVKNRQNDAA